MFKVAIGFAAALLLAASVQAEPPRMAVEVACLSQARSESSDTFLKEKLSAALKQSKVATEGLPRFLAEWFAEQDRSQFNVDLLTVKLPLGEEVEVTMQRGLGGQPEGEVADGSVEFPRPLGVTMILRGEENEQGQVDIQGRFEKRGQDDRLATSKTDPESDKPVQVAGMKTFWVDTQITLDWKVPAVLGGLVSEKKQNGKTEIVETVVILRASRGNPVFRSGS